MSNYYLPQKSAKEVNYTITTPGLYTWTAPNAKNTGASYEITLQMWGAGSGGMTGNNYTNNAGGGGGAGGAYVYSKVTVIPGTVYTFRCGALGAGGAVLNGNMGEPRVNAGVAGESSYILDGGGAIITAGGGSSQGFGQASGWSGTSTELKTVATGGTLTTGQAGKVSASLFLTGGNGGFGRVTTSAGNGGSVSNAYGQPGGTGGSFGGTWNPANSGNNGGGGGASSQGNGGTGGYNAFNYGGAAGGGGGAGFTAPTAGDPTISGGSSGGFLYYGAKGGNGGAGRFTFLFITEAGGSAGVAPA